VVLGVGLVCTPVARAEPDLDQRSQWLAVATAMQASIRQHLRVLGDAETCPEARFVGYRRSDREPDWVDQWYVASQIRADIALLRARGQTPMPRLQLPAGALNERPDSEALCHIEKGFVFLDRLWDDAEGGYYSISNPFGTDVVRGERYGDDNALAGLALVAALDASRDAASRARYGHAIRREAAFLRESGLWDDTFGGGFWWNTAREAMPEGKPAQTNALAALFFARAFEATGDPQDREWALRTLLWLDTVLFDPGLGLYRWSIGLRETDDGTSVPTISPRLFNYDQGIAITAQLAAYHLDGDPERLARSVRLGHGIEANFRNDRGGYNLEHGIDQVYASYAAWTSLGHLALHAETGDEQWRELARRNADELRSSLAITTGGVAYRAYRCVDVEAQGCETPDGRWVTDPTFDGAAQAWVQRLFTALSVPGERAEAPAS
jgi:Glycosyl hydrolase family 76